MQETEYESAYLGACSTAPVWIDHCDQSPQKRQISLNSLAPFGECFAFRRGCAQRHFQTLSLTLRSPRVPPGGSQGTQKSPGPTAYSECALGRRCSSRVLHRGAPGDTEAGGGDGHPKVTQRLRRALALPAPTPERLPILLPGL